MSTPLDSILSHSGEAMPSVEQAPAQQAPTQQESTAQPGTTEQPSGREGSAAAPTEGSEPSNEASGNGKTVPIDALHAERQEKRLYKQNLAAVEERLAQLQAAVAQQQPKPLEPAPEEQMFTDFTGTARRALNPELTQLQQEIAAGRQRELVNARLIAEVRFTPEKVAEAEAAFNEAAESGRMDPTVHSRINSSPNPFAVAVQWYEQQQRLAPDYEQQLTAKIEAAAEEKFRAKYGIQPEQANGAAQQRPAATVFPSDFASARNVGSRSGPAWGGPLPMQSIFAMKREQQAKR